MMDYTVCKLDNGLYRITDLKSKLIGLYDAIGGYMFGDLRLPSEQAGKLIRTR